MSGTPPSAPSLRALDDSVVVDAGAGEIGRAGEDYINTQTRSRAVGKEQVELDDACSRATVEQLPLTAHSP
ncbi:hypothetical protein ACVBEQ_05365 [Nakamurella sp. GG22]